MRVCVPGHFNFSVTEPTRNLLYVNKLAVVHIDEIVEISQEDVPYYTESNEHGWMDRNGWLHRTANVINAKNGNIYQILMDLAKSEDGRIILYALNGKIKKVGNADVNSIVKLTKGSSLNSNYSKILSQNYELSSEKTDFSLKDSTLAESVIDYMRSNGYEIGTEVDRVVKKYSAYIMEHRARLNSSLLSEENQIDTLGLKVS